MSKNKLRERTREHVPRYGAIFLTDCIKKMLVAKSLYNFFPFLNVIYTEILDISYDAILFAIVNKRYYLWNELHSFFIRGNIRYSYVTI